MPRSAQPDPTAVHDATALHNPSAPHGATPPGAPTADAGTGETPGGPASRSHEGLQPPIESVDRALQLARVLRHEGALTVTDAAELLGVAPSTAHRILTALTFRGFAVQDRDRRYLAGPELGAGSPTAIAHSSLRALARPALEHLHDVLGETVALVVLHKQSIRFLDTIEDTAQTLRVSLPVDGTFPAHKAAAGKALLSLLRNEAIDALYADAGAEGPHPSTLKRQLAAVRRTGYGTSFDEIGPGVAALAVAIPLGARPFSAFAVAIPDARYDRERLPEIVGALKDAAAAAAKRLTSHA
jgi:IclR family acetate operon transcriptional repressor